MKYAVALEHSKKVNRAEKDNDILQMIIGWIHCNYCHVCKEVSLTTQFFPQNVKQFAAQSKYYNPLGTARADNSDASQNYLIWQFLTIRAVKRKSGFVSHSLKQCTVQQIITVIPQNNLQLSKEILHDKLPSTQINFRRLRQELKCHPDSNFVEYLCLGLQCGFDTVTGSGQLERV